MKTKPYSIFWDDPLWPLRKETDAPGTATAGKESAGKRSGYSETNTPDTSGDAEPESREQRKTGIPAAGKERDRPADGGSGGEPDPLSIGDGLGSGTTHGRNMRSSVPEPGSPDTESTAAADPNSRTAAATDGIKVPNRTDGTVPGKRDGYPERESLREMGRNREFTGSDSPVATPFATGNRTDTESGNIREQVSGPESLSQTGMTDRRDAAVPIPYPASGTGDDIFPHTGTGFANGNGRGLPELSALRPFPIRTTAGERLWQQAEASPDANPGRNGPAQRESFPITREQVGEMIDSRLSQLRVYVLESDITEAQQAVRSVVEQASF